LSNNNHNNDRINISGSQGDVIGVNVSGSYNTIGKNIIIGDGTINVSETKLQKLPNEYAQALREFSSSINEQLNGRQIQEDNVKLINNNIDELAKEVENVKPGEEEKVDYVKKLQIEGKTASIIQRILEVLPEGVETAATFTPLAPFSKIIGKTIKNIVDAVSKN
jgi:hypothetical protein